MRCVLILVLCAAWAPRADAAPDWTDVPALLVAAAAPVDAELRACATKLPKDIALIVRRTKNGTRVAMPIYAGHLGISPEDSCLIKAAAKIDLPALPVEIERMILRHTIVAANASAPTPDKAFDDWRDPVRTLATLIDAPHRAALAACDPRPRTVRLILDRRGTATRIWLPAWQFHAANGDGTTPPAQRRVKACLTRAIRDWRAPLLPSAMGEMQLAISTAP